MKLTRQPWIPAQATDHIRKIACDEQCSITFTRHASERMKERGLIMSDVLWVLRTGFVQAPAEESTVNGFFKFKVEGRTPNSQGRATEVVVVTDMDSDQIKTITVMWKN